MKFPTTAPCVFLGGIDGLGEGQPDLRGNQEARDCQRAHDDPRHGTHQPPPSLPADHDPSAMLVCGATVGRRFAPWASARWRWPAPAQAHRDAPHVADAGNSITMAPTRANTSM